MSSDVAVQTGSSTSEPDPATVVITRVVQPGREQDYRPWMGRMIAAADDAPHSLGTVVLAPKDGESNTFRLIHRFADADSLRAWEDSDLRVSLSAEADQFSSSERQSTTGLDSWFTIGEKPAEPSPLKWKTAILTFFLTYALTAIIIPREQDWLPKSWSFYLTNVITNVLLAVVMTYLMPFLTRLVRRWLY